MKFIDKLRGPALNAANVRIKELEEELDNAKSDAIVAWNRVSHYREEKAELKDQLESALKRQRERQSGIVTGLWCDNCKSVKEIAHPGLGPLHICEKQVPCAGYEARE